MTEPVRDDEEEPCERCGGTEEIQCPDCEGMELFEDRWDASSETHYTVDVTCETCDGEGTVPCPDCT